MGKTFWRESRYLTDEGLRDIGEKADTYLTGTYVVCSKEKMPRAFTPGNLREKLKIRKRSKIANRTFFPGKKVKPSL